MFLPIVLTISNEMTTAWEGMIFLFQPIKRDTMSSILKIILAIILPPLGVALEYGVGGKFFLNLLLTILGYIPGVIHALLIL